MIPIAKPIIEEEEINNVVEVLKTGIITQGPKVAEFEKQFAELCDVKYAVATSSGTTALHTALVAAGIKANDEVITVPFTFIASSNSVLFCNAKPVFVDINEDTFNIDPNLIQEAITSKTKAILPVHLYGQMADMDVIMDIAKDNNLIVIEDAAQAHATECKGRKAGSIGNAGCFSFYPTKNMTTSEGGMITTNNKDLYEKAALLRGHGMKVRYYHEFLAYNYRMTDLCAAIGLAQIKKLQGYNQKRIENAAILNRGLSKIKGIITPKVADGIKHVYHQYTIKITEEFGLSRNEVSEKLKEKGIGNMIYYPVPIHQQKFYIDMGFGGSFPKTEKAAAEVLSLPVHPSVNKEDIQIIIKSLKEISQ